MKSPKKKSSETEATIESVLNASIATLALGIDAIRAEIELIASNKGAKSKHDKGSRIAFMTARVGSIADSIRKVEAARAKRFDHLTAAMVLAYLRQLDVAEREHILREASQIDARKSGLG